MTPADPTRALAPEPASPPTETFGPAPGAGPAAPGNDPTPGGWTQPPLLRDDPSEHTPLVQPGSAEMPRGTPERYQLLGEIARGGMGVVLKGRDPDLGRDLAFKVLRSEFVGRPAAEQRFVEEAQVGGQLQHPGVIPVYDLGRFPDGRPYFAMKLVKGRTLADHLADRPNPAAERGRFLQVFLQVCQTVAYAHAKGVIHRDIKPSNVMVGSFGEVLVMDWGLAKVLPRGGVADELRATQATRPREQPAVREEPTVIHTARSGTASYTEAGSIMGTPAFMSPEQAAGEVEKLDERADVFGLGAVLCTILAGQPPYVADTSEAVRLMAVRGQLAEGFARLDACGADAELIALCRRCLAAERDERPRDADEVAKAVAAHLAQVEHRAHQAEVRRAAAEAEAREQHKRRRVQLALAASVGLLLLGGGAFGWYSDRQAVARRAEAANRERDEQARRDRNADALAELVGRCEDALRHDDADRAAAALAEIDRRLPEGGGEALAERVERCRAGLAMLRELDAVDTFRWTPVENKFPDRKELAHRWRAAFAAYGIAVGEAGEAANRVSRSPIRDRLLAALDLWLVCDPEAGVRAVLRAADPDEYRDAVRDAVAAQDAGRLGELAARPAALTQPPWFAIALGHHAAVPAERRRAVFLATLRSRPGDIALLMGLGSSYLITQTEGADERLRWYQAAVAAHPRNVGAHNNLGIALKDKGDLDGAVASYREAIRLSPSYVPAHNNLGIALFGKKDLDAAISSYREAIRLDPKYFHAHYNLGLALRDAGDAEGAIARFHEAIRLNPKYAQAHTALGNSLRAKGDPEGAIACYREAIRQDPKYALAHNNLGLTLRAKGDVDGAIFCFEEAIRVDPKSAPAHNSLGGALRAKGDADGAIACYREAIRLDPKFAPAHNSLGNALRVRGDVDGAIAAIKEAIRLDPKSPGSHDNLGLALRAKGDVDGALSCFKAAIRLDAKFAPAHYNLGNVLRARGDLDGAVGCYREAVRLHPRLPGAHHNLGLALRAKGDVDGAIACFREAIRLAPTVALGHSNLASALRVKGDYEGTVASYLEAIRLDPKRAVTHNELAWLLAVGPDEVRDGKRAVTLAARACELTGWKDPVFIDTLAAAHAGAGEFDKAVEYQKKALEDPEFEKRHGAQARARLALYTEKKPYRDPTFPQKPVAPPPREVKRP